MSAARPAPSPRHAQPAADASPPLDAVEFQPEIGRNLMQQPAETGCWAGICSWWTFSQVSIEHFVMDQPLIAIVTAVVFAIFGISQVLPTIVAALLISIPLLAFSYLVAQTIYNNQDEFAYHLVRQFNETNRMRREERDDYTSHSQMNSPERFQQDARLVTPIRGSQGNSRGHSRNASAARVALSPL